jgi:hypothetical protein
MTDEQETLRGQYDKKTHQFSRDLHVAVGWKHNYFGAAYTTRLKQAIAQARLACDDLERYLKLIGEWD